MRQAYKWRMPDVFLVDLIKRSNSFSDVATGLGFPNNGSGIRKAKQMCTGFSTTHFGKPRYKCERLNKNCPVCNKEFVTPASPAKSKATCSYACANKFFRKGPEVRSPKNYRTVCFANNKKKCAVCEESLIVEVHHMDEDRDNNNPDNLVPLCPTHHQYWHSRYRNLIEERVYEFIRVRATR